MASVANFTETPGLPAVAYVNGTGTALQNLTATTTKGVRITNILITTDDNVANDVKFYVNDGSSDHLVATIAVPVQSGDLSNTPGVSALNQDVWELKNLDSNNNWFFDLPPTHILKANVNTVVTAAKTLTILVSLENF